MNAGRGQKESTETARAEGRAPSSRLHLKDSPQNSPGRDRPATREESLAETEGFHTGRVYFDLPACEIASPYHENDPLYQWWLMGLAKAKQLGRQR